MEMWKKIECCGISPIYEINIYGRIRSISRVVEDKLGRKRKCPQKLLFPQVNDKGYHRISLCLINGKRKNFRVDRLVGFMFIDNPHGYPQINHKNGNKRDNYYKNLEWVTSLMNVRHAISTGLTDNRKAVY